MFNVFSASLSLAISVQQGEPHGAYNSDHLRVSFALCHIQYLYIFLLNPQIVNSVAKED